MKSRRESNGSSDNDPGDSPSGILVLLALVQKGELNFTVQESTDLPPRENYIEATRVHSHSVTLGQGRLDGYVAGMPFPSIEAHDPRAGEKVMWNFRYRRSCL